MTADERVWDLARRHRRQLDIFELQCAEKGQPAQSGAWDRVRMRQVLEVPSAMQAVYIRAFRFLTRWRQLAG